MPLRPKRPCHYPGCPNTHRNASGYCESHAHLARKPFASAPHSKHYSSRIWLKASAGYLAKHPHCSVCGQRGRLVPAIVVDHTVPHRGDMSLFWDSSNWQPLCKACHDSKTAREANARRVYA